MSTPARFSDGQYKNWLKCSQSLIIMKEALHDYIDNEVRNLHGDITLKVSSIPCSSASGNQCGSCLSKDIKQTGGKHGNWNINCKKNICDKWLHEILAVHDDPHNPTINWKNADISKWPTDCYHVAKIFMPKGQDKTTKMPDDLDAPAILSLLKYCNWFRKDLPSTQILSDLIDIRNKVLHSGDLRVADSDKDSWIDLMIQLLSDLNIHGDAQSKIQMLKKEDIDINFRENEIRLLQKMVSGLFSDLTTVKGDMAFLQNSQSDLSQDLEELRDSTIETTGKVNTVEADIEGMRKSLEELKVIYDKMVSFFDKNPGIIDKEIAETIRIIGNDVKDLQSNLSRVETELQALKARVSVLENHSEETNKQVEETKKNQEETWKQMDRIERRVAAVEEQKKNDEQLSLQRASETARSRRPENEGLTQLKYQTEDKLDTLRRLQSIPTKQAEEAKKLLEGKRSIVIKGNPGEGKTTMAFHLIDNEMYRDRRVVLNHPRHWENVDTAWVDIVVLEDVFGQYDFDPSRLQKWMVYLPTIEEHVDAGKLRVIVTTRVDILSKAYPRIGKLKLFSEDLSLTLSSEQLKYSEKMSILNRQLYRHERNMKEDEKEKCISNFIGLIGFPQCCSLFAGDSKLFDRGPEFFSSPNKLFVANIAHLEDTRFLSLAFLFCISGILEEHLSPETMPDYSKHLLMELASSLNISEKEVSITLLRDAYENFLELYVVKSMLFEISFDNTLIRKPSILFTHATVYEAVGQVLGDRCPEMVVKYGDSEYLYQRTYTAEVKDNTSQNVFIPVSVYGLLAGRMVLEVVKRRFVENLLKHSAFKQHGFLMKLKDELYKGNVMKDFFMADLSFISGFKHDLLEGMCKTFMQHILQSDEDIMRLVYSQLLELLACAHNGKTSDCWQCEEKQKLLELALYYHHFEIADKLITMNACYTHVSLSNAARHGDLQRVQTIIETLKRSKGFNPECKKASYALCRAYISGNQSLTEFLLKEGIILDSCHIKYAVEDDNMNALMKMVEHLKCHNKWNPHEEQDGTNRISWDYFWLTIHLGDTDSKVQTKIPYTKALYIAYVKEEFNVADYLLKNGVKVSHDILVYVSISGSQTAVARVIQDLKDSGTWDPHCDGAYEALEKAYSQQKYDVYDLLVQEGVSFTMKNLPGITGQSLEPVKKAVQYLKDTDSWDPKCDHASEALAKAYNKCKNDVCDLLVQEGVSLRMKNLTGVICNSTLGFSVSLDCVRKAIQLLKDSDNWDPKCNDASEALAKAYNECKVDVCELLVQEGVPLTMKNLHQIIWRSLGYVKTVVKKLKDVDNWDPKCDDASKALEDAYRYQKYDVCDLLIKEGVSLTMKILPAVALQFQASLKVFKIAVQCLKDTDHWDPKCDDASNTLGNAYSTPRYDVCDLLIQEGVSLRMKNLSDVVFYSASLDSVDKAIQHLKDAINWDPKCDDASHALAVSFRKKKYDVFDLLVQNRVSLKMKNLPYVVWSESLQRVKKAIQHLKVTNSWNPKCDDASEALAEAYKGCKYDICDRLVQEGVSLKMKNLSVVIYGVLLGSPVSLESIKKVIQQLKDAENWDPKCDDASEALAKAYIVCKYHFCDLLVQHGVSLGMKNLPHIAMGNRVSLESVKKAIQHLKDTDSWNPKCNEASEALSSAYMVQRYDVCDLLVQEEVSLTMEDLPNIVQCQISLEFLKKAIQHLKDTDSWDPKCDDASEALVHAYILCKYDMCDTLIQEGVPLTMKNFPCVAMGNQVSSESVKKAIQHLKDTDGWNPKCNDAYKALEIAYSKMKRDVYDLLVQQGVSPTVNLCSVL